MKSVLISIKPKYCELIANGKKTIEVRKTKPKLETPFKCYIYCTEAKYKNKYLHTSNKKNRLLFWHNKGDCEIICEPERTSYTAYSCNGKVIGEFVCDEILDYKLADVSTDVGVFYYYERYITQKSYDINSLDDCLTDDELLDYGNYKNLYGWHISDLKVYDKPKELSKFIKCTYPFDCCACDFWDSTYLACAKPIRPPQSWCYVEELRE